MSEVVRRRRRGLTRPVPEAALDVVLLLRREVRRPAHLPVGNPLRFDRVWISGGMGWSCPMGLHPDSRGRDEPCGIPFGEAGESFSAWWDEQEDAKAATDAVWGNYRG